MKKFAHITDTHLDEDVPIKYGVNVKENWETILNDVKERGIEFIVFNGDIGTPGSNKWLFDSLKKSGLNYYAILGNHDKFEETVKHYNPDIPEDRNELYYSFEDDSYRYIFLDSSSSFISSFQFDWLKDNLKTDKKINLFIHHPVLETNTTPQREYPLHENEKIKSELNKSGKEINIFCGHLHLNDERSEANIKQFVTPAASYQAKRNSETSEKDNINFGYRIVEFEDGKVNSQVVMFYREYVGTNVR